MVSMKRLTTDNPQDNIETSLNLFYVKDHETWVRGGGTAPEYADVSLFDFTRRLVRTHIPDVELPEENDDLSMLMAEWLFDGPESAEGLIATLYAAAWAFAELRHRLAAYEDTGLEPEDISLMVRCAHEDHEPISTAAHIRELLQAEQTGQLVVLPFQPGKILIDFSDPEKPELLKKVRVALAYDRCGIVFYQPIEIFLEKVQKGYIRELSEEFEVLLRGRG